MLQPLKPLNETFFGRNKTQEYILHDLALCTKRLVIMTIMDHVLFVAAKSYEPHHTEHHKDATGNHSTTFSHRDPQHFIQLKDLHKMGIDAYFLSLRSLFANSPSDRTSGGAFLRHLKNLPNLPATIKTHQTQTAARFHLNFHALTSAELKKTALTLKNGTQINPKELFKNPTDAIISLHPNKTKNQTGTLLYTTRATTTFQKNLNSLYDQLYPAAPNGKRPNNYPLIKSYEQYNFHKDHWGPTGKFQILTETHEGADLPFGKVTHTTKLHQYKIRPGELHQLLNDFALVTGVYMHLGGVGLDGVSEVARPLLGADLSALINSYAKMYNIALPQNTLQKIHHTLIKTTPALFSLLGVSY